MSSSLPERKRPHTYQKLQNRFRLGAADSLGGLGIGCGRAQEDEEGDCQQDEESVFHLKYTGKSGMCLGTWVVGCCLPLVNSLTAWET